MQSTRHLVCGLLAFALFGVMDVAVQAQEGRWGVGGTADFSVPLLRLRERWGNTGKYGGALSYAPSTAVTIELAYSHQKMDNGKPASESFVYGVTGETLQNPGAVSEIEINSLRVNALVFAGDENSTRGFKANDFRYYALVGGGYYRYKAVNENLVYPLQSTDPIDMSIVMEPQVDQRYAYGGNLGLGVEAFVTPNMAIDLRTQLTFIIGELRPQLYYDLEKVRPLVTYDIGAGVKFYFWR